MYNDGELLYSKLADICRAINEDETLFGIKVQTKEEVEGASQTLNITIPLSSLYNDRIFISIRKNKNTFIEGVYQMLIKDIVKQVPDITEEQAHKWLQENRLKVGKHITYKCKRDWDFIQTSARNPRMEILISDEVSNFELTFTVIREGKFVLDDEIQAALRIFANQDPEARIAQLEDRLQNSLLPKFKVGQKVYYLSYGKINSGVIDYVKYGTIGYRDYEKINGMSYGFDTEYAGIDEVWEKNVFASEEEAEKEYDRLMEEGNGNE